MSAPPWIQEVGTGRFYTERRNEYGEIERRYSNTLSGARTENQTTYGIQGHQIPRSESSTQAREQSHHNNDTTRFARSQKPRRDSISVRQAIDLNADHPFENKSRAGHNESRSNYHHPGGYNPSPDEREDENQERLNSSSLAQNSKTGRRYGASTKTHHGDHRDELVDGNDLSIGMRKVTIDDVVGSPSYTMSTSNPARSGRWDRVAASHEFRESSRPPIREEKTGPEQLPVINSPVEDASRKNYRDKGKAPMMTQPEIPSTTPGSQRHIRGTTGEVEYLDKAYKVRNHDWQKFFRPGRVFSTLWTDAFAGTTNESEDNQFMSCVSYVIFQERVYSKIRRFLVVRLGDRCCTCLPVTTYDGRGYRKGGINLDEHGLIFNGDKKPSNVRGINKMPLRVNLSRGATALGNPSYINYGRVYTVHTNVKVKDVGELDSESKKHLRVYYNQIHTLPEDEFDVTGLSKNPGVSAIDLAGVGGAIAGSQFYGYPMPQTTTGGLDGSSTPSNYDTLRTSDRTSIHSQYSGPSFTAPLTYQTSGQAMYATIPPYHQLTQRYSVPSTYDLDRTMSSKEYAPVDWRHSQNPTTMPNTSMYASPTGDYTGQDSQSLQRGPTATFSYSLGALTADSDFLSRPGANREFHMSNVIPTDQHPNWNSIQTPSSSRLNPGNIDPLHTESRYENEIIHLPSLEEAQEGRAQRRQGSSGRTHASRDIDDREKHKHRTRR